MQIIKFTNNKLIDNLLNAIFLLFILGLIVLPYFFYIRKFYYGKDPLSFILSNKQEIWGTFGDFIGGTTNTVLNIIVLIITVRISLKVHEESKNLQEQQIRPYPMFVNVIEHDYYTLKLYNGGLGPLIIKKITFKKADKIVNNLEQMLGPICTRNNITFSSPTFSELVIAPNTDRVLFDIAKVEDLGLIALQLIYNEINGINIELEYSDIFSNTFPNKIETLHIPIKFINQ